MFVCKIVNDYTWFLRSTTWTSQLDRASKFATREEALAGLAKAKKFTAAKAYKAVTIEEVSE